MPHRAAKSFSSLLGKGRRDHGFQCPLHPLQLVAWSSLVLISLIFFTSMLPQLHPPWPYILYAVVGVVGLVSVVSQVAATWIDPVDPCSKLQLTMSEPQVFDRSQYKHVIEQSFCHICSCRVHNSSKHCRPCNKCVVQFDHHCSWLNNCVGAGNYKWFFVAMTSSMVATTIVTVVGLVVFIAYYTDADSGAILLPYSPEVTNVTSAHSESMRFTVLYIPVQDEVWQTVTFIFTFLAFITSCLLIDLFTLHLFLCSQKLTTFEYVNPPPHKQHVRRCPALCWSKPTVRIFPKDEMTSQSDQYTRCANSQIDFNDNKPADVRDQTDETNPLSPDAADKSTIPDSSPSTMSDLDHLYSAVISSVVNHRPKSGAREKPVAAKRVNGRHKAIERKKPKVDERNSTENAAVACVDETLKMDSCQRRVNFGADRPVFVRSLDNDVVPHIDRENTNNSASTSDGALIYNGKLPEDAALQHGDVCQPGVSSDWSASWDSRQSLNGQSPGVSQRKQKRSRPLRYSSDVSVDSFQQVYTVGPRLAQSYQLQGIPKSLVSAAVPPRPITRTTSLSSAHLPTLPASYHLVVPHLDLSYLRSSYESNASSTPGDASFC